MPWPALGGVRSKPTVIIDDRDAWWGNLRAVGDQLYASHYEWVSPPGPDGDAPGVVRYYLDRIDLSDPNAPRVAQKINVPGILVGGSADDPSIIYTVDYHWDGTRTHNEFAALELVGDKAYVQGHLSSPGHTGNVFVRGSTAYFSVQDYNYEARRAPSLELYQLDLADPKNPVALPSEASKGWGWLLSVEGDRAFVMSGWSGQGIDVFKLEPGKAPAFDQFVRARGWWHSSLARSEGGNGDTAFLASGYWGTQVISLAPAPGLGAPPVVRWAASGAAGGANRASATHGKWYFEASANQRHSADGSAAGGRPLSTATSCQ